MILLVCTLISLHWLWTYISHQICKKGGNCIGVLLCFHSPSVNFTGWYLCGAIFLSSSILAYFTDWDRPCIPFWNYSYRYTLLIYTQRLYFRMNYSGKLFSWTRIYSYLSNVVFRWDLLTTMHMYHVVGSDIILLQCSLNVAKFDIGVLTYIC